MGLWKRDEKFVLSVYLFNNVFQNEILVPILKFQEKILIGWLKNNINFKTIIFLICMCSVAQWCVTLCDPLDCSLPGSSGHGTLQTRILEWVFSSGGSSQPRCWTSVSCIAGGLFTHWAIWDNTKIRWVEKKKEFSLLSVIRKEQHKNKTIWVFFFVFYNIWAKFSWEVRDVLLLFHESLMFAFTNQFLFLLIWSW